MDQLRYKKDRPLLKYFNKKYFFTLSWEECLKRRRQRCYLPPEPEGYFEAIVWPRYLENRALATDQSDIVYLDGSTDIDATFQQVLTDIRLLFKQ
ncbi:Nicotinamide riboside kinase 2 [Lamellibrachia satsuma]|nr:Nicotinamide riboside kinase 2 [Lamellibrachia satsuma]